MAGRSRSGTVCLALAAAGIAIGCAHAPPAQRTDIAVIEAGDASIQSIDGAVLREGNDAAYELRPGGHTIEATATRIRPLARYRPSTDFSGLVSLCLKAKGGRTYRIKKILKDGRLQIFIVDKATGEPPRTPCGPDEDDD